MPDRSTASAFLRYLGRLRGGVDRAVVGELAERLDLDLERRIGDLSKGNKQKVGVIAAFMHDPELLVLDEPTSGLDPLRQRDVLELVRERAAAGRTVFLSSHELDQVEHVAERVGIVREGQLVAVEEIAALKQRALRRVEVRFAGPADGLERLRAVPGSARSPSATAWCGSTSKARWTRSSRSWRSSRSRASRARRPSWTSSSSRTTGAHVPIEVSLEALRERRRSLLWWTLGVAALVALNVAFYPSVRDDEALSDYAKDLPESVRALFAGGELDLASPVGYLNSQVYALMAPLLLLIFSIGAGAAAVAGEEERGTLDLVLTHPVRRRDYVLQRLLALAVLVTALTLVLLATVALGSLAVDLEISFARLVSASVSVGLLALLFGTVALAAGAVRSGRARAIAVAAGLAVASWMFDGLAQAVDALEPWRPLLPYYHALGQNPLREGAQWGGWAILAAATAVLAACAAAGLERRDVRQ